MKIINLTLPNRDFNQRFIYLKKTTSSNIEPTNIEILKDKKQSLICRINNGEHVLKFIPPRTFHEHFKLLWGRSRVTKEVSGNHFLMELGINTPEILDYALGLIPTKNYSFIGFLTMENLEVRGYFDAFKLIKEDKINAESRSILLENFMHDIKTMRAHRVVFSDLKLNNIFSNPHGEIIWIDTGVSSYSPLSHKKFIKKHNNSITRFLRMYSSYLNDDEINSFQSLKL